MEVPAAAPLFAWAYLEDSPSLLTLRDFLAVIPDEPLLAALEAHRGKGRDDYPVRVCWGVCLLTVALRHVHTSDCLAELKRNVALRLLIGIEQEADVPHDYNMTRFLQVLGLPAHLKLLQELFATLAADLGAAVPDLGGHCAADATALSARRDRATPEPGLPQPNGGRKEYMDDAGHVTAAYAWFGYKLHLLVDTRHEVALAYQITDTKAGDGETLPALLAQADQVLPPGRLQTLAYDKAADTEAVHAELAARGVKPVIQMRQLWRGEPQRAAPGLPKLPVDITYDELGTLYCTDPTHHPPVCRRMKFFGYEKDRHALKYRCPALYDNFPCGSEKRCNCGKTFGLTVRLPCALDPRRFPAIPRATKTFERTYKTRTAIERVNARLKLYWGVDDGNVTGAARFHAQVGVVLAVHLAFATLLARAPRHRGTLGHVGLGPVQEALRQAARTG